MKKQRSFLLIISSALIFCGGIILSLFIGATKTYDPQVFWFLRVPRTISAIAVGGGLGVAGTLIQASLAHPLADPFTTGIASAAVLGAVIGTLVPSHSMLSAGVMAFIFAMIGLLILSTWLQRNFRQSNDVLLAGIVSGFFFTSLATLIMALSDPSTWSSAITWMMGSLGHLSVSESVAALLLTLIASITGWLHWKPLDLLSVDELSAEAVGVDVPIFRRRLYILVAFITAVSVSTAGVIGFLGLVVPHVLRRIGARHHIVLVPLSFLVGAGALLCSDVVARTIARPSEIPVGVIMAILGAPCFFLLARKSTATK